MKQTFSGLDEARQATRTLLEIKQTGSVQDYTTKFQDAAFLAEGHSDLTLRTLYHKGLKNEIKKAMALHEDTENLEAMIRLALKMEQLQNEYDQDQKTYRPRNFQKSSRHTQNGGDAMELDAAHKGEKKPHNKGKGKNTQRRKFTPQEQERFDKGLCFRCGEKWDKMHQ